ncbi:MAG TPA: NADPH:quinone oxidoreductase family protein [Acidimicrobiales bacterium]|jgi:NADPH2:quinone reductase|nr:NADPH:quinone oxidoreductase family protein [Acidimicrobiales bacterium]
MRAVVCHELGPLETLVVEEQPRPSAGEGQVVVDIQAAGVNFVDGLICQGRYQIKPPTPFVPGSEIAGEVSAVGPGVAGVSIGDRVIAFVGFGGFADQAVVPALSLVPMPDSLDFARGAALIQSYSTMLFTLTRRTTLSPGEWVLVLGAGGGVGLAAVDIATALGGRVIAAASNRDKLDAARSMGAEATIDYETEDLKVRARELSGGGVDVVVDPVGGRHSEPALRATRHLGRFCVIGFASGPIASVPLNQILLNNRTVVGVDWGGWTFKDPVGNRDLIAQLMGMVGDGRLHPVEPTGMPLDRAATVMTGLIDRSIGGKAVLVP